MNDEGCGICGVVYHASEGCGRIHPQVRVLGAVLGQAIGDAIGHPIEFIEYGSKDKQVSGLPEDNKFTDDTRCSAL